MLRSKAKPIIERHIAVRKWHEPPKPVPGMPVVRIDDLLLAGFGRDPDYLDDIAAQIHLYDDFPDGFQEEDPNTELQQVRIPFETTKTKIAMPAHVIFHDGRFWVSGSRFL
jgi:hypothetical protein